MASGASRSGKAKVTPFKKGPQKSTKDVQTIKYGDITYSRKNIEQAAAESRGAKPKKAETIVADYKHPQRQQLKNIQNLGSMKYGDGDNPYKGSDGPAKR